MNKKVISLVSLNFVLVIGIIGAIFAFDNRNLKYKELISIEIGEKVPTLTNYVSSDQLGRVEDKKIKWKNLELKDNRVYSAGKYEGTITFNNKEIIFILEVVDDIKPVINGVKDVSVYVNENVDLLKDITVSDNSDDDIDIKVLGSYDISLKGEYLLTYVAVDKSGNEERKEFKLIVKEKEITSSNQNNSDNDISFYTSNNYLMKRVNGIYYINNILIVNKTYSLPSNYNPNGLLNSFSNSFYKMKSDAFNEGINLFIVSGFRSYYTQADIYNRYVIRDGVSLADTYSARSGHSEHQSGLAADINSLDQNFINTKEGKWLNDNCYKYGFIIRYPSGKEHITGYMYEPWHIRYVGTSLATTLYNEGNWITLEEYFGISSNY